MTQWLCKLFKISILDYSSEFSKKDLGNNRDTTVNISVEAWVCIAQ